MWASTTPAASLLRQADARTAAAAGEPVLRIPPRGSCLHRPSGPLHRPLRRPRRHPPRSRPVLQHDRAPLDRPGVDDPHADRRVLLRHPLGAASLPGGASEPRVPLVLPPRSDWCRAGPFHLLEEPPRPVPGQRPVPASVRDRAGVDASLIKADANREDGIEPERWSPADHASRATTEYLATLDDASFGAVTSVQQKYVSPVDPAARWSAADRGKANFLHAAIYLVDLENAVIVDVEVTAPIRQAENKAVHDRAHARPLRPLSRAPGRRRRLRRAEMLAWLVHELGIEPHIPVIDAPLFLPRWIH
jgi:hypothetical protein